jgi:hypothetical protein
VTRRRLEKPAKSGLSGACCTHLRERAPGFRPPWVGGRWRLESIECEHAQPLARHPAQTLSVLTYRTSVQDANLAGNVHGGWIMKLCDDAA